jgi:hypothetical protein
MLGVDAVDGVGFGGGDYEQEEGLVEEHELVDSGRGGVVGKGEGEDVAHFWLILLFLLKVYISLTV